MPSFVIVGEHASPTGEFRLDDIPGTSGRLDILLRCIRAALLSSHGLRADVRVYLVLRKGPRVLRIDGAQARFIRPDERALAVLVQKVLSSSQASAELVDVKPGIAIANADIDVVLREKANLFLLDELAAADIRDVDLGADPTFILGDHTGLTDEVRSKLGAAVRVNIGPVSVHADDAVAIVTNEIDRRRK